MGNVHSGNEVNSLHDYNWWKSSTIAGTPLSTEWPEHSDEGTLCLDWRNMCSNNWNLKTQYRLPTEQCLKSNWYSSLEVACHHYDNEKCSPWISLSNFLKLTANIHNLLKLVNPENSQVIIIHRLSFLTVINYYTMVSVRGYLCCSCSSSTFISRPLKYASLSCCTESA